MPLLLIMVYQRKKFTLHQIAIGQWLAWWLSTGEVPGSNLGKGDNWHRVLIPIIINY